MGCECDVCGEHDKADSKEKECNDPCTKWNDCNKKGSKLSIRSLWEKLVKRA